MQLAQGAEAIIRKENSVVIKERFSKEYRIPELDTKLRKFRTRREAKVLRKLEALNFPSPKVIDSSDKEMTISMEFIDGEKVKDTLTIDLAESIGKNIATLHSNDIVHGDLTTSNMILKDKIYFIDFGLSMFSDKVEDKAVDLFLLDRALATTHSELYPEIYEKIIKSYVNNYDEAQEVLARLERVHKRGRNKKR